MHSYAINRAMYGIRLDKRVMALVRKECYASVGCELDVEWASGWLLHGWGSESEMGCN